MTTTSQAPATPAPSTEATFGIQRIFLKNASFEMPGGAKTFLMAEVPKLTLSLQVGTTVLAPDVFETVIRATLTATVGEVTGYLVEIEQGGVFEARNLTPQQLSDCYEVSAPSILAPYLRAQLSDFLTRATLPMFLLPEINWSAMALEKRERAAQEVAATPPVLH